MLAPPPLQKLCRQQFGRVVSGSFGLDLVLTTDVLAQSGVKSWCRQLIVQSVLLLLCIFFCHGVKCSVRCVVLKLMWHGFPESKWTDLSCKRGTCLAAVRHHSASSGPRRRRPKNDRDMV